MTPENTENTEELEQLRRQFDQAPFPRKPLEAPPDGNPEALFILNLVTPYYLRHRRVTNTEDKLILDAGCGTGFKSLVLAKANPGARIIGIDLSKESINLASERLKYHGFTNVEFHALPIEEVPQLGLEFDYINCDEVLYLLPNPLAGLKAMKSVLKPDGLLRANLHHMYQRAPYFQAQALFRLMGVMHEETELAEKIVIETMEALKDETRLKFESWGPSFRGKPVDSEDLKERLHANQLLAGDKGFTVSDLFNLLAASNLEFVSMVNWRHWDVTELFNEPENLPFFWSVSLAEATVQDKLHVFELLHSVHRLMDFWCTHPGPVGTSVDEWSEADWHSAMVHLHPQLQTPALKTELIQAVQAGKPFEISRDVKLPALTPVLLEASTAACLLPLWEGPQPIQVLVERYRQIRPVNPVTLEPTTATTAFQAVRELLNRLDAFLYVLLERR
ncbi:MAG: class I SAM-dependent methyltransferase [Leptolyngbya sp. IPPAS B-1204]|nr:MAG: class I SAM-dependent methyltransferase [Leptolyngbya sp. IPPAS B-1204]